ncbi:hypothetical protein BGZ76_010963 [Entomortierella beljakovae]|nr:hypothetical protein BGZ76_010963 [Entomortierella beljakovae]
MPPRPARSAKKNVSYKLEVLDDDIGNRKPKSKGKNKAKKYSNDDDDGDSDEYVEPQKDKEEEEEEDDDDLEMLEDEDEDMPEPIEDDIDDDDDDEDGGSNSKPARKKRRQKVMNSFSVSLDEMTGFLDTRGDTQESGGTTRGNRELKILPATLSHKVAPVTATSRSRGPYVKGKQTKKGEMRRDDNLPDSWMKSFQGPSSNDIDHVSMSEDVLRDPVYTNIVSSMNDFKVITEPSEMDEYLPVLTSVKIHARDTNIEMETMTSRFMPSTDKACINESYILNTGFSVWALDWCPLPSYNGKESGENMNYIAVGGFPDTAENCIARDQLYPLGKQDAHPNIIQLWKVNCETDNTGRLKGSPESYLSLCILHSYGAVLDLKWCPTGGYLPAGTGESDLARLGILAGSFTDGTIRFFTIPDPVSLHSKLGLKTAPGSQPDTIYKFLDPVFLPQVHDVCVRSIDWLRNSDPTEIPCIIATSGYDGHVRYTDLRDMYAQIDIKTILGVPMITRCVPWADGTVYIDIDLAAKLDQLYLECRGFRSFSVKGTIWDISCSDYQPYLAAAISDGHGMAQNRIYQLQAMVAEEPDVLSSETIQRIESAVQASTGDDGSSSSHQENPEEPTQLSEEIRNEKIQTYSYVEGEDREFVGKSDGLMKYYDPNIPIQKVQWSRSYHSAAWLASGSAGGIVRIDNTILQNGKSFNNSKVSSSNMPPPKGKIGRPKKNTTETTTARGRGRKKKVTEAVDDSASIVAKFSAMTTTAVPTGQEAEGEQVAAAAAAAGPSSAAGRRSTRQSTKLAPIFARTLSSSSQNSLAATSTAEDEEDLGEGEGEDEIEVQAEVSTAVSTTKPKAATPRKKPTPRKAKGSVKTPASNEPNKSLDADGDISMIDRTEETTTTENENLTAGVETEKVVESTTSTIPKGKSKATTSSARGRPAKSKQKSTPRKDNEAGVAVDGAVTGENSESNATTTTGVTETIAQSDQDVQLASASSSRASSAVPSSPRKKRAPAKPKKRAEETGKNNRSLKDMWGSSTSTAAKGVEDGDK